MKLKKILSCGAAMFLPSFVKIPLLNLMGHQISRQSYIGMNLLLVDKLCTAPGARVGHFNLIACRRLLMRKGAYIESYNVIRGPLSIALAPTAAIGMKNRVRRPPHPVSYGPAKLQLGILSKITSNHSVDCTCSVVFGDYTTLAGRGSQIWTHGYYFESSGPGRFRVDGPVTVGNNVSIGSSCAISMGVRIGNAITIGSLSSVSKSLVQPGLYVSQPLRFIESNAEITRAKLQRVDPARVCEEVYRKPGQESPRNEAARDRKAESTA